MNQMTLNKMKKLIFIEYSIDSMPILKMKKFIFIEYSIDQMPLLKINPCQKMKIPMPKTKQDQASIPTK